MKLFGNTDRIISMSAMLISLGTLFIIVYQTTLTRKAQKASVLPYLEIALSFRDNEQRVTVTNSGLGPAIIQQVSITSSGRDPFLGSPSRFAASELGGMPFETHAEDLLTPGRLIAANKRLVTFQHAAYGEYGDYIGQTFKFPYNQRGGFVIVIEYQSVYGDRCVARSDENTPQPLH